MKKLKLNVDKLINYIHTDVSSQSMEETLPTDLLQEDENGQEWMPNEVLRLNTAALYLRIHLGQKMASSVSKLLKEQNSKEGILIWANRAVTMTGVSTEKDNIVSATKNFAQALGIPSFFKKESSES